MTEFKDTDFITNACPSPTFSPDEDLDENEVTWVWKRAHAGTPARKQPIAFDKIRDRLFKLKQSIEAFCGHKLHINIDEISQYTVSRAFSGITTSELDEIAAAYAGGCVKHPDYTHFSGCLLLSNLRANLRYLLKDDRLSFESFAEYAYNYIDDRGENTPLVSKEVYALAKKYGDQIDQMMKPERDFIFHHFGVKTLVKTPYLICRKESVREHREVVKKNVPIETPQHMWMRVALGIWGDNVEEAFKVYEALSTGKSIFASPTLFSSGTTHPTLSSCFLLKMKGDDLGNIFDTARDCALISKNAGGIGVAVSNVRSKGSFIGGTNGTSNGIKPMLKVLNNIARYVDQGGNHRKGAFAIYLEPWHADVEDFLQLKLPHGSEEDRARDLFYALWCPDLFFERVAKAFKTGEEVLWSLLDPKVCRGLDEVWGKDFTKLYETYEREGKYVKQVSVRALWKQILETQKATGTPYILSKGNVNKYSMHSHLGTIKSSNLCVSGETKILTSDGYQSIKTLTDQQVHVWNGEAWSQVTVRQTSDQSQLVRVSFSDGGYLDCTEYHKFYVQEDGKDLEIQASALKPGQTLIDWNVEKPSPSDRQMYFFKTYEEALEDRLKSQERGFKASITLDGTRWKVNYNDATAVKVEKVSSLHVAPTYCFNEPLRHKGVFNGYLTGQCAEIVEYTAEDQTAVCNLSSIPIGNYVKDGKFDYQGLYDTTRLMIRSLNRVIDVTKYPIPESYKSNMNHRPVGLGVSGVANAHFKLRIPFDSQEALDFHHKFSETMYFAALTESHQLALEQGPFDSFKGSKLSKGLFHWEQWQGQFKPENEWMNTKPHPELKWDWEDLREKVKKDGVRNSLLIAYMPTASTGQICNMWEGAELPYTLPCARKTKSGEFTQWEREMVMDFIRLKLWKTVENPENGEQTIPLMNAIISNQGSLQITSTTPEEARPYLEQIPLDIRRLYQGAFDVPGEVHRKLFRVKAPWIDQTMSFNIYFKTKDEMMVDMTKHLLRSWKMGLKTISYYTRTLQQTDTVNVSKVKKVDKPKKKPRQMLIVNSGDVCVSCS